MAGISTSWRRRVGRLRAELAELRPPDRPRLLADRGDEVLTRLGVQLTEQEWLDQVEEVEAQAAVSGVPAVGFTRSPDFARGGVRRLPVTEQLLAARRFAERYLGGGVQPRPVELVVPVPVLTKTPPAELVPASEAPVSEPEAVLEDGRRVLRSTPPPAPPPQHVGVRRNGHRRSEGRR